ncbi:3-keto-disaccharide hydrolase [Poritiphilus flavus]|uniref:DUF1080 domain-containing protein n=1 Tax=Poritiphilus flavus TaxID=2697053 RepID=A0A6L9E984_9FLAO|nr:DUF1080 domain-containing protein [Poritiphilus flavus]NAS11290.1 DUF1080 domain-containing protein [Poritiphilus flavus]
MRLKIFIIGILLIFGTIFCYQCKNAGPASITLFGENSDTWFERGDASWAFDNGDLVGTSEGGNGFVMSRASYRDFVLELEFNPDSSVNSGVFVRCKNEEISNTDCYEMNIWDEHPDQDSRTGSVVTRMKPMAHVNTLNKWNTYKVECSGNVQKVWVNGVLTAEMENNDLIDGYIALQAAETGSIRFRNVTLSPLSSK